MSMPVFIMEFYRDYQLPEKLPPPKPPPSRETGSNLDLGLSFIPVIKTLTLTN
jgi:hypothetical protein